MTTRTYIATEERIGAERATLAIVVRESYDQNVLDRHHHEERPNDKRQGTDEVLVRGGGAKGGRVDVERTGSNVSIDHAN